MLLKNAKVLNGKFNFCNADIVIKDGKIEDLLTCDSSADSKEVLDLTGLTVIPGLIDIHTHGCAGFDTMDATDEAINAMSVFMAENGVTSFLPTTMTATHEALKASFTCVKKAVENGTPGANVLGSYMEGPYFAVQYKGAQNEAFLRTASLDEMKELQEISGNNVRVVSLAPELEGSLEFIKDATSELGMTVAIGHSAADYETASKAVLYGATQTTHLFNAMTPLTHRAPGVVGTALDHGLMCEIISDGIHLHPATIRIVYKTVGAERVILISDSMRAAGLADGNYDLGGQDIIVKDGVAKTLSGAIAGSTAKLMNCVKNAISFGIKYEDAVMMASLNPAKAIGLQKNKGSIQPGKDADLVVINDNFEVIYTIIGGKIVVNNNK